MKKRSGIAAIILSLSIAGSAQAANPILTWFGTLISVNVLQYAVPYANLYLTYRNGQKIEKVSKQVTELSGAVGRVDEKVTAVDGKVTNLQESVGTLDTKVTTGFSSLNTQVGGLRDALGETNARIETVHSVVKATDSRLTEFQSKYTTDMKNLGEHVDSRFNEMAVQMTENESSRQRDTEKLTAQGAETLLMLKGFESKLTGFESLTQQGMQDISIMKALLEQLVARNTSSQQEENQK